MKLWNDFIAFTNLKGARVRLTCLLVIPALLYCFIYNMTSLFAYAYENTVLYYGMMYVIYILAAYFLMLILSQFVAIKRNEHTKLHWKTYFIPVWFVHSIYFLIYASLSYGGFQLLVRDDTLLLYNMIIAVSVCMLMLYVPMQLCSLIAIYDGDRNPFTIIKRAFIKCIRHYRSLFYALLAVLLVMISFQCIMSLFFQYEMFFSIPSAALDMLVRNNPFLIASELMHGIMQNTAIILPFIVAFVYGILLSILLVYFYMLIICVHDEDIRI